MNLQHEDGPIANERYVVHLDEASLPVTGELDPATLDALRSKYGC